MNRNRIPTVALTLAVAAAMLSPVALMAQDPSAVPQAPQNQNMPSGAPGSNQPGSAAAPSTGSMRDSLGAPGETGQQMEDKLFVQNATEGGIAQIQIGKLAVQKGSPDVKEFAQKLVDDHIAINKDMATVADEIGTMLPRKMNKEAQAEYDKLNALSGDAFDKEYILYVAKEHRENLRNFRMEMSVASDQTLQAEVAKAGMVIRQHLMALTTLAKAKGVELPARPPRPATPPPGQ